jgi:hypothetical protein
MVEIEIVGIGLRIVEMLKSLLPGKRRLLAMKAF